MEIFDYLFSFFRWLFEQEIEIDDYHFSLVGAILFCGGLVVIVAFFRYMIDGDWS